MAIVLVAAGLALAGRVEAFPAVVDLSSLDGSNGFVVNGVAQGDISGASVSGGGDVNGDGIADLIIGASSGYNRRGQAHVVFGRSTGFGASLDLGGLDGANGFTLNGISSFDRAGRSVSDAGDVNGDGYDDVIVGAPDAGSWGGQSYVVFGKQTGFPASQSLYYLDGANGFSLDGGPASGTSGRSVSGAGDVNGDGYDDVIIGAPLSSPDGIIGAGQSYVVFGKASGFGPSLSLGALNGTNGFTINGTVDRGQAGESVSGAGDVNGDGYDDVIIGAFQVSGFRGRAYVVFGKAGAFPSTLRVDTLNGVNGFAINGSAAFGDLGMSVSGAGDVNGDGFADVIVGAPYADVDGNNAAGHAYVLFGKSTGFAPSLDVSSLDGTNGFAIHGIAQEDAAGESVSGAGDVNGDGFADLIIGARYADPDGNPNAGQSYVVFGRADGFPVAIDLASLDGTTGFTLNGLVASDELGRWVSNAGDVNGDGCDDLIVGAPSANSWAGQSYVVFGEGAAAIVPEPTTVALLAAGCLLVVRRRSRRRP